MNLLNAIQPTPAIELTIQVAFNEVLNMEQAAYMLGFKESTLRNKVNAKQVPHYKNGAQVYFFKEELKDWIETHRVATNDELDNKAYKIAKKLKS